MTRIDDSEIVARVHVWLDVVVEGRRFSERGKHVERAQRASRCLDLERRAKLARLL